MVDLTCVLEKPQNMMRSAQPKVASDIASFEGVIEYVDEAVLPSDFVGHPHMSIFEALRHQPQ